MSKFFRIVGEIQAIETIASGVGVKIRQRLQQRYGRGAWRKMKGLATICLANGK